MLIKAGVYIDRLERNTRRALYFVDTTLASAGEELVITSTYEGNHSPGSLHYANQAFDIRLPKADVTAKLKVVLGKNFDVLKERNHIHIEYDPK